MKKIFSLLTILFFVLFIGVKNVYAGENDTTLTTSYIDNVWSFHYRKGVLWSYGQLPYRYLNGKLAYCIEPDSLISSNTYSSYTDWGITNYSVEDKKQMELISHYGYGYPGHDSLKYYMATQHLIWMFSGDDYIKWTVSSSSDSEEINIEKEINDIQNLVKKHNTLPSFVNSCYVENYGIKFSLNDTNNVLQNYDIETDLEYTLSPSSITFNLNKFGDHTIRLKTKNQNSLETVIYKSDGVKSQTMAIFGFNDIVSGSFSIMSNQVSIRIFKKDLKTGDLIKDRGTVFRIKDLATNKYVKESLSINKSGYATTRLNKGKYEIEEISASDGYVINKQKINLTVDENIEFNGLYHDIDFYNDTPKGKISITKLDEDGKYLENVEFGIYDEDYKLIKKVKTDKNGYAFIENLEIGTYYVKELSANEGYILDEKYHKVKIEYVDDKTEFIEKKLEFTNKKIKCDVTYITSNKDGIGIENIEINVYNDLGEIVYNGKTNKDGKIIIEDLPYGNYYIKQLTVPSGYILNKEQVDFSVNDISCLSDINVINENTNMPVTSTSKSYVNVIYLLLGVGIIVGFKKLI